MIIDIILNIVFLFVDGIIYIFRQFGTVSENSDIVAGINEISSYLSPLNDILPIDTIVAILVFELIFEGLYLTYKLIRWGYTKVPLIN